MTPCKLFSSLEVSYKAGLIIIHLATDKTCGFLNHAWACWKEYKNNLTDTKYSISAFSLTESASCFKKLHQVSGLYEETEKNISTAYNKHYPWGPRCEPAWWLSVKHCRAGVLGLHLTKDIRMEFVCFPHVSVNFLQRSKNILTG